MTNDTLQQRVANLEVIVLQTCVLADRCGDEDTNYPGRFADNNNDDIDGGPWQVVSSDAVPVTPPVFNCFHLASTWDDQQQQQQQQQQQPQHVDWGPWQSAIPSGCLAQECAAAKTVQRSWRRLKYLRSQMEAKVLNHYDPCYANGIDTFIDETCARRDLLAMAGLDIVELKENTGHGHSHDAQSATPLLVRNIRSEETDSDTTVNCDTCGAVQPESSSWIGSFSKTITFTAGHRTVKFYCRASC